MIRHHFLGLKGIRKWAVLGTLLLVLVVASLGIVLISEFSQPAEQMAYLAFVSGDVRLSDGNTETIARKGDRIAWNARTLVLTSKGIASLSLGEGVNVILDSASAVEFNRPDEKDNSKPFVLNLLKGKILVENRNASQKATSILLRSHIAVRVFHATMGFEITADGDVLEKAHCLIGQCLVDGAFRLKAGQTALIGQGRTIQIVDGVVYAPWILLGRSSQADAVFLKQLEIENPTSIPTPIPSISLEKTGQVTPLKGTVTNTVSVTASSSPRQRMTPSPAVKKTVVRKSSVTPRWIPTLTVVTIEALPHGPQGTLVPSKTSTRIILQSPTLTPTIQRSKTPTLVPTATSQPIVTPIFTSTYVLTATPWPTVIPSSTAAPTWTATTAPTETPKPRPTRKNTFTHTPVPVPTDTPVPIPTDTPVPVPTDTPVPVPTDTLVPLPTDTPVPVPTDTPVPVPTDTPVPVPTDTPVPPAFP